METTRPVVQVQCKTLYGNRHIYPLNETAHRFCSLLQKKTLSLENLIGIKHLGYEIQVLNDHKVVSEIVNLLARA